MSETTDRTPISNPPAVVGTAPESEAIPLKSSTIKSASAMGLSWVLRQSSLFQGNELDRLRLYEAINTYRELIEKADAETWQTVLEKVSHVAGVKSLDWMDQPEPARFPLILFVANTGWGVIRALTPQNKWVVDFEGKTVLLESKGNLRCARLVFPSLEELPDRPAPAKDLIRMVFMEHSKLMVEAGMATILINLLALGSSFFTMQVYDRVIPSQSYQTLLVLTGGVVLTTLFDLLLKVTRSNILEHGIVQIDTRLSREIFGRLLKIRLDQLPFSVGTLSGQLRGYETVRSFMSTSTLYVLVDVPFAFVFIFLIGVIGAPALAAVPFAFLVLSLFFGAAGLRLTGDAAKKGMTAGNRKTGVLVEAIEGAETIKSGGGGWTVLSKWIDLTDEAIRNDLKMRNISEKGTYIVSILQQGSYIALIAIGAYLVTKGEMTMGSLIACSILSGRALSPVAAIPGMMVQAAHAKAALDGLEALYRLKTDNHGVDRPLAPTDLRGDYQIERVRFIYPGSPSGLVVQNLTIQAGEKIGIVGPVGAGKSTLLRILSGTHQPAEGRILLGGLEIGQISVATLAEQIGLLQQDHRMFSGTLRENILIGTPDPGDEAIRQAAAKTGLLEAIAGHPRGLNMMITEGGKGLSGGQKQMVALTRLLISNPSIWLLDEPTASMDQQSEDRCLQAIVNAIQPTHTMVVVTHRQTMLQFVHRLIVVVNHQILMDGPRDEILRRLSGGAGQQGGQAPR